MVENCRDRLMHIHGLEFLSSTIVRGVPDLVAFFAT